MTIRAALIIAAALATASLAARAQVSAQGAAGAALGAPPQAKVAAPPAAAAVKAGTGGGTAAVANDGPDAEWSPLTPCMTLNRDVNLVINKAMQLRLNTPGDLLEKNRVYLDALPPLYREGLMAAARNAVPPGLTFPFDYHAPNQFDPGSYPDADTLARLLAGSQMNAPTPYLRPIIQRGGSAREMVSAMIANNYFWRNPKPDPSTARFARDASGGIQIIVGLPGGGATVLVPPELQGMVPPSGVDSLPTTRELVPGFGQAPLCNPAR